MAGEEEDARREQATCEVRGEGLGASRGRSAEGVVVERRWSRQRAEGDVAEDIAVSRERADAGIVSNDRSVRIFKHGPVGLYLVARPNEIHVLLPSVHTVNSSVAVDCRVVKI